MGARVSLPDEAFVALFSESTGRAIVAVEPDSAARFAELCATHGVPQVQIGVTEGTGADAVLDVEGQFAVALADLRAAWTATLPDAFA